MTNPFEPAPAQPQTATMSPALRAKINSTDDLTKYTPDDFAKMQADADKRVMTQGMFARQIANLLRPYVARIATLESQLDGLGDATRTAKRTLSADLSELDDLADTFLEGN